MGHVSCAFIGVLLLGTLFISSASAADSPICQTAAGRCRGDMQDSSGCLCKTPWGVVHGVISDSATEDGLIVNAGSLEPSKVDVQIFWKHKDAAVVKAWAASLDQSKVNLSDG